MRRGITWRIEDSLDEFLTVFLGVLVDDRLQGLLEGSSIGLVDLYARILFEPPNVAWKLLANR